MARPVRNTPSPKQALVVKENDNTGDDFDRLTKIGEYFENEEFKHQTLQLPPSRQF